MIIRNSAVSDRVLTSIARAGNDRRLPEAIKVVNRQRASACAYLTCKPYFCVGGGTIPFIRRYSTSWP